MGNTLKDAPSARQKMTVDEFFEYAPEDIDSDELFELEEGEIVRLPLNGEQHGMVCSLIVYVLTNYIIKNGFGRLASNTSGLVVKTNSDTVLGPDIMYFHDRLPATELSRKYTVCDPALVVEVVSPTDRLSRINKRIRQYHERGVKMVWIVYPEDRNVNVHIAGEFPLVLEETDIITGGDILPGFSCSVSQFFNFPGTTPSPEGAPQA